MGHKSDPGFQTKGIDIPATKLYYNSSDDIKIKSKEKRY
jgi:hypothetical protein